MANNNNEQEIKLMQKQAYETMLEYKGTIDRIQCIFAFHYDQIQRELETELFSNPFASKEQLSKNSEIHDYLVAFMEETMNWPSPDDRKEFIREITGYTNE